MKKLNTNSSLSLTLLLALLLSLGVTVVSQTASRPSQGFGGEGGYQTSEIDAVSLQSGSLNVNIPLASLPPMAGGKLGYTLQASYNSKLWNVKRSEVHIPGPNCGDRYTTQSVEKADGGAGWRIGGRHEIFFRWAKEDDFAYVQPFSDTCDGASDNYFMNLGNGRYFKPMLRTPDGAEHELRVEGTFATFENTSTDRKYMLGYYKWPGGAQIAPEFADPVRFYTIDGTYLTAVYDAESTTTRWTIYGKDGTRIEQSADGVSQRTTDMNGNSMLLGTQTGSPSYFFARDEQTGREIRWSATTHESEPATEIEYQSVGGTWQSVIVVWGTTEVKGKVHSRTGWNTGTEESCIDLYQMPAVEFTVIREIIYPLAGAETEPRKFIFEYNSDADEQTNTPTGTYCGSTFSSYTRDASLGWGELSKIITPTDSYIEYGYANWSHDVIAAEIPQHNGGRPGAPVPGVEETLDLIVKHNLASKKVHHDGEIDEWTYGLTDFNNSDIPQTGMVENPDGSIRQEWYFPTNTAYGLCCPGQNDGMRGQMVRSIDSGRVMTERSYTVLGGMHDTFGAQQLTAANAVVDTEYTTLLADDGETRLKMTAKKFEYDYNGDLTKTIEYDWFEPVAYTNNQSQSKYEYLEIPNGIPTGATVLRVTDHTYYNSPADSVNNKYHKRTLGTTPVILGKPKSTAISLSSTVKSRTEFYYDNGDTTPDHGNLTETRVWDSATDNAVSNPLVATGTGRNSISTFAVYAANGNVTQTTDANGNVTAVAYDCVDGAGSCDSEYEDLYPTQTVVASGTSVARTSTMKYDFFTGLPLSQTDEDNDITNSTEYDILGRPVKVISADATALESWTQTIYNDEERRIIVKSDLETLGDGKKIAIQHFDQLGRVRLARTLEDSATQSATNEEHGIKVETRYKITGFECPWDEEETCSGQLVSNPFRADTATEATGEETMAWTLSLTQNNGRYSQVETFAGAGLPAAFGGNNTNSTGIVRTEIDVNTTKVTDQAGKVRRSVSSGIEQLIRVDEPNTSDQLDVSGSPYQPTSYTYDVLNNLLTVTQASATTEQCGGASSCSQTRTFSYSSLSRLLSATNPESGTIQYEYDNNGNLTEKTDARSIVTTYTYDALNRVTARDYDDTTPDVDYFYGTTAPKIGKLTKVDNGISATEYTSFDILGRVTASKQTTDGVTYGNGTTDSSMTYSYNLSGALIEQQYPSGRKVRNELDASGDLAVVESKKHATSGPFHKYASNFAYNAAGAVTSMELGNLRYESTVFNSRLQPTQIALGTAANGTNLLDLDFEYGATAAVNNGNVTKQTINVATVGTSTGFAAVQTYNYDALNRLKDATENLTPIGGSVTQPWKQSFKYDRYGNRNFLTGTGETTTLGSCATAVCNPEISPTNNKISSTGYTFDSAGNTRFDAALRKFTYDAENKQTKVESTDASQNVTGTVGQYWYDGDGKRVKKEGTGPNGQPEYTVFVYDALGKLVAEYSTNVEPTSTAKVAYVTNDHLGSPRIKTDANGAVTARHDYYPFGEEIATSQRTSGLKYAGDTVRKQFTGYERDNETGLGFAQARMYANQLGRFSTVDSVGPDLTNPQTLNKYQYCLNNPLRYIDKNGKYEEDVHRDLTRELAYAAGFSVRQAATIGRENQYIDEGRTNPIGYGPEAYRARSKHHFTTEEQRNSLWGDFENAARNSNETNQLMRLGTFMHAQQDSFSHDGYSPLLGQATDLFKDGIVPSYEAASRVDKTDSDPAKAERMAEDSFKRLVSARNTLAGTGRSGSFYRPISYGAIKPLVARWVRESDPQKKAAILTEIRKKIQNGRDVQDFPKNVVNASKRKKQEEE